MGVVVNFYNGRVSLGEILVTLHFAAGFICCYLLAQSEE